MPFMCVCVRSCVHWPHFNIDLYISFIMKVSSPNLQKMFMAVKDVHKKIVLILKNNMAAIVDFYHL